MPRTVNFCSSWRRHAAACSSAKAKRPTGIFWPSAPPTSCACGARIDGSFPLSCGLTGPPRSCGTNFGSMARGLSCVPCAPSGSCVPLRVVRSIGLQLAIVLHTDFVQQVELGLKEVDVAFFVLQQLLKQLHGDV